MKDLVKIIRVSSKEIFKEIREVSPFFCNAINEEFFVTDFFYQHVTTKRSIIEMSKKLSAFGIIKKIIVNGKLKEIRNNVTIDKEKYLKSFRVELEISGIIFYLVIGKKFNGENILISIFSKIKKK